MSDLTQKGSLASFLVETEKHFGKIAKRATLMKGYTHIPTGVFLLDFALLGGIPEGVVSMIYGWSGAGKTSLCLRTIASAQAKYPDKSVLLIDAELAFDKTWAIKNGVDTERLIVVRPTSGEQATDIIAGAIAVNEVAMIVIDSVPALVPNADIDKSAEDVNVGKRGALMGRLTSKIYGALATAHSQGVYPTVIMINQFRREIGKMFGDNRILPGGEQMNYMPTVKIELKTASEWKGKSEYKTDKIDPTAVDLNGVICVTHNTQAFEIKKSRIGNCLKDGEYKVIRTACQKLKEPWHKLQEAEINDFDTVLAFAKKYNLYTGGGRTKKLDGVEQTFMTDDECATYLQDNRHVFTTLKQKLIYLARRERGMPIPSDNYILAQISQEFLPSDDLRNLASVKEVSEE